MGERVRADIIDNSRDGITMQKILSSNIPFVEQLDISTGYFDVDGYGMLRDTLEKVVAKESFAMRLLLGKDAIVPAEDSFEKYAERYVVRKDDLERSVKSSLDQSVLAAESLTDTASLLALLERPNVQVRMGASRFNHSKCYILGNEFVLIGSSNFTAGGLVGNHELNAGLYQPGVAGQTREWFEDMWGMARDAKDDLISVLNRSKFGAPPEPYEVYMKMLFEAFRPLLGNMNEKAEEGVSLTRFQQDAVRTALFIMSKFGGVMIADATGLGKTNMGMEILRQKVLGEGKKALLIAPAQVLRGMWENKLKEVDVKVRETVTAEYLGRETGLEDVQKYRNIDLVIIDESQNFRSSGAGRRKNLMKLLSVGKRKQVVLLSATPINNSLMDLYYQLSIITGGDDSYFYRAVGIPNLKYHLKDAASSEGLKRGLEKIQQLLNYIMVRRTRSFIRDVYRDDTINGTEIKFPTHEYHSITYSLSELFGNIFQRVLDDMGSLTMAPYGIDQYNMDLPDKDRAGHKVRAHLQTILLLKRFESSVEAVRISLENKIKLYRYIGNVLERGKILRVRDFNRIMGKWSASEGMDDGYDYEHDTVRDSPAEADRILNDLEKVATEEACDGYDLARLKADMEHDMDILGRLLAAVNGITVDTKIDAVISTILRERALERESGKVLIFTEYTATARYVTRVLKEKFSKRAGVAANIRCITGDTKPKTRKEYIERFAPGANLSEGEILEKDEISVLVSTEVLSEGQNLQDCNYVINYDLPWNPMRIVQRTGRIDRLTSAYGTIHSRACYPDRELNNILNLWKMLIHKINTVNQSIGLDSELLGEEPTPRQFNVNVVPRVKALAEGGAAAEGAIIEMERESDMMPLTTPINELFRHIKEKGMDAMREIPMGRRSGKKGATQKVVLAYVQERPEHRVHFVIYDYSSDKAVIPDDDTEAIEMAMCGDGEPLHLPMDGDDGRESFNQLLGIDRTARNAIREKNDRVLLSVEKARRGRRQKHEKNVRTINRIVLDGLRHGRITQQDAEAAMSVARSRNIRPWEDDIAGLLAEYEMGNDPAALVAAIKKKGRFLGYVEGQERESNVGVGPESDLKIVGAMFITGEAFDPLADKRGVEKLLHGM